MRKSFAKTRGNKIAGKSNDSSLDFKQIFSTFQQIWRNMERKSLNGHATVVVGHATVGRLPNNVFGRFGQLGNF